MQRRDLSRALFASAAGVALLPKNAEAATCPAGPCYPVSAAEVAVGVAPTNYQYPPGNVLRYGATGNGSTPDDAAFTQAIACNDLVIVPDPPNYFSAPASNFYLFSKTVSLRSGVTLRGANRSTTIIKPATSLGVSAPVFLGTNLAHVTIENLGIVMPNSGYDQYALQFNGELQYSTIQNNYIIGPSGPSPDHIGIYLASGTGADIYSGGVLIDNNTIFNVRLGIVLGGSNTTVRVTRNTLDVGGTTPSSYGTVGVDLGPQCTGVLIEGNQITGWIEGIYSQGGYIRQIGNYFEGNSNDWYWVQGAGNSGVWNSSIGDINPGQAGLNNYPSNTGCIVLGQGWLTY